MAATNTDATPMPRKRRSWLWAVFHGGITGFLLVVAYEATIGTLGDNVHTVVPGRIYRSGQLSSPGLERFIRERGIRTVINLRGSCPPMDWYLGECRVTHLLNVAQEDIGLSATRLPAAEELRRLVEVLDHCEYPILFHCFHGADRTGLACAIAQLLDPSVTLEEATRQLGICYGHLSVGKTGQLDRVFEFYTDWLAEQGIEHSPDAFRRWVADEYCPGECRCALELLEVPCKVERGKPFVLKLRSRNTSIRTWQLRAGTNAGIHAVANVYDSQNRIVTTGRAGLFDAEVAPGESIDLILVVPAIRQPGRYRVMVDMADEQICSFYQAGSEPREWEIEVGE
jgi:protein tyrosine/serine phosphatase